MRWYQLIVDSTGYLYVSFIGLLTLGVIEKKSGKYAWSVAEGGGLIDLGEGTAETLKEAKSQAETFAINVPML